jgi:ribosomal-protein-alanine N-acetyltransferase
VNGGVRGHAVAIRPMTRADLPAVVAIERDVQRPGWSEAVFRDELGRADRTYLVAEVDGAVVGYAGVLQVLDEGHVSNVAVARDRQGRGVGRLLLLALHQEARARGIRALTLEVRAGNEPAKALYRRFGYAPVGVRPRYYADDGEDALILWAHDVDSTAHGLRLAELELASEQGLGSAPDVPVAGGEVRS